MQSLPQGQDYFEKVGRCATRTGLNDNIPGNAARSSPVAGAADVPVRQVFDRLKALLMQPSISDVAAVLKSLELAACSGGQAVPEEATVDIAAVGHDDEEGPPPTRASEGPTCDDDTACIDDGTLVPRTPTPGLHSFGELGQASGLADPAGDDMAIEEAMRSPRSGPGVDDLFIDLSLPLLPDHHPPQRPRQRRHMGTDTPRRSERLAKKPSMLVAEMAQRNLLRKLGIPIDDGPKPMEQVLKEVVAMFTGPLPPHIIGAMTALFDLDDDTTDAVNATLIEHAGEAATNLATESGTANP